MTPHDNGPRDGDFVRYIDELTARVAATTAATAAKTTAAATEAAATAARPAGAPKPVARPAPITPAFAIATLGFARLFTIGLFVVGGLLAAIGALANGLEFLFAIGIALLVWAGRRQVGARKVTA